MTCKLARITTSSIIMLISISKLLYHDMGTPINGHDIHTFPTTVALVIYAITEADLLHHKRCSGVACSPRTLLVLAKGCGELQLTGETIGR